MIRGASRALRAEHENAGPRQIAFGDWERGAVAGFEAPLHPSPPPRSHPPGYAEVPRNENRTKSHERTACQERTMSFTPAARAFSPVLGCAKSFVIFRETFVSRCAAKTPEGWRLRERQRPSLLESSDTRADSNRSSGRFRSAAGFRVSREAPVRLHEHKTFLCGGRRCAMRLHIPLRCRIIGVGSRCRE